MAQFEIIMPKMGESITEATIIKWFVKEGASVVEDDVLLEIATDKVDSEIPSPVAGTVKKILFKQDDVVAVGSVIAVIDTGGENKHELESEAAETTPDNSETEIIPEKKPEKSEKITNETDTRFYSPLVRKIARDENISDEELASIKGSGLNGRVQKNDILSYLENVRTATKDMKVSDSRKTESSLKPDDHKHSTSVSAEDEIIEMNRMRKLTAEHMIRSINVSAHVTNMLEADVTNIVNWRNKIRDEFEKREGQKITYLPIFFESVIKALKDFPLINASVEGDKIIVKKRINLGVAVSLPDNNLIVPVIKNAEALNITGLTKELNRLAYNARNNLLKPDDIQDGTFTVTNFGSFRNTIGTPIINQPQVAILAIGTIEKKPAVLETPDGDVIAIRHKMFLSLTYDHRIIDGALGGAWLRKLADYIESFDTNRTV